ncbi:MAG TPA: hypothetical protein VMB03_09975 [Bryobacteraceae bacterium]|nr:hypothetical protein [Bryobacteraceae bacterium]
MLLNPGPNIFLELGFPPDQANRGQAASRQQINDARLLKQQLTEELSGWIAGPSSEAGCSAM